MKQFLAVVFVLTLMPSRSRADDTGPPGAPEGWQYVLPKDRSYQFLFPKDTSRIGYTSRKFTARGISAEVLMNYCTLRDDTVFDVEGATLTGRLSRLKVDDLYEFMLEDERRHGFTVGESKETAIGKAKAREYRMSKGDIRCRAVLLVVKNRVFKMRVCAGDESKLNADQANTFFQSFRIIKESPDTDSKEEAATTEERNKELMEKFGFKWTLKLDEMTPPDKPVTGLIHGREFKPDSIVFETGNTLRFRQGPLTSPEADVRIVMFSSPKDKFENRTIEIKPGRSSGNAPTILLTTQDPSTRVPKSSSFDKFAMKLTFGAKGPNGMTPCTIYLCTSDSNKSFMAGKFALPAK